MIICRTLATYKGRWFPSAPRSDPYVQSYRIRLLPWVMTRTLDLDADDRRGLSGCIAQRNAGTDPRSCVRADSVAGASAAMPCRPRLGTCRAVSGSRDRVVV